MRVVRPLLSTAVAAALLTACGDLGHDAPPSWQPSPSFGADGPGAQARPIIPVPSGPGSGVPGGSQPGGGSAGGSTSRQPGSPRTDPNVVATKLNAPVGLTILPDGSALVGERTTGRIVHVQPEPGRPVPTLRVLHGLDTTGDGGLLDLALSPTYSEDGLVYAYVTTPRDNRVVDFTLHGPVTPVFTGIPKGRIGNTGRIMFGPDGDLYIGTGDAGRPRLARDPQSLAGKVLRVDPIGDPVRGNPVPTSPVWTTGQHVVDGLCAIPQTRWIFDVEAGAGDQPDEVNLLGSGSYYGWPAATVNAVPPVASLPPAGRGPGGCAVLGNRLWVTSLDGEALLSARLRPGVLDPHVGSFSAGLVHRYGRLRTVVAAPDGALWLTTSNRDGHGRPVPDDERVIRIIPAAGTGSSKF